MSLIGGSLASISHTQPTALIELKGKGEWNPVLEAVYTHMDFVFENALVLCSQTVFQVSKSADVPRPHFVHGHWFWPLAFHVN